MALFKLQKYILKYTKLIHKLYMLSIGMKPDLSNGLCSTKLLVLTTGWTEVDNKKPPTAVTDRSMN